MNHNTQTTSNQTEDEVRELSPLYALQIPPRPPHKDKVVHSWSKEEAVVTKYDPLKFDKDILYCPREWSPDLDVHAGIYDNDPEDGIEVRPCGTVLAWLVENIPHHCFGVDGPEVWMILDEHQTKLIRDRFGLYPPP